MAESKNDIFVLIKKPLTRSLDSDSDLTRTRSCLGHPVNSNKIYIKLWEHLEVKNMIYFINKISNYTKPLKFLPPKFVQKLSLQVERVAAFVAVAES